MTNYGPFSMMESYFSCLMMREGFYLFQLCIQMLERNHGTIVCGIEKASPVFFLAMNEFQMQVFFSDSIVKDV